MCQIILASSWYLHFACILAVFCLNFDCHTSFLCTAGGKVRLTCFSGFGPNDSQPVRVHPAPGSWGQILQGIFTDECLCISCINFFVTFLRIQILFICLCAWLQEELQGMKQRIRVVVVENEKLQSGLKSKAVDESLKDYTIQNATVMCVFFKNRVNDVCVCDII